MPINYRDFLLTMCEYALNSRSLEESGLDCSLLEIVSTWREQIQQESTFAKNSKIITTIEQQEILDKRANLFYIIEINFNNPTVTNCYYAQKLMHLFPSATSAAKWLQYYTLHLDNEICNPIRHLCKHVYFDFGDERMPKFNLFKEQELQEMFINLDHLKLITKEVKAIQELLLKTERKTGLGYLISVIKEHQLKECLNELGDDLKPFSAQDILNLKTQLRVSHQYPNHRTSPAREVIITMRKARNSDQHLPNIFIKSEEVGLPAGYYMTKLPENDARASLVGTITGCCQHLGNFGARSVVEHSIESEFGAVYVIFRGKAKNTSTECDLANNRPMTMAWVWAEPAQGVVCFDSIQSDESKIFTDPQNQITNDDFIDVFHTECAKKMLESNPVIQHVTVGVSYRHNSLLKVGRERIFDKPVPLIKKSSESKEQLILATRAPVFKELYNFHALDLKKFKFVVHASRIPLEVIDPSLFNASYTFDFKFVANAFNSVECPIDRKILDKWKTFAHVLYDFNLSEILRLISHDRTLSDINQFLAHFELDFISKLKTSCAVPNDEAFRVLTLLAGTKLLKLKEKIEFLNMHETHIFKSGMSDVIFNFNMQMLRVFFATNNKTVLESREKLLMHVLEDCAGKPERKARLKEMLIDENFIDSCDFFTLNSRIQKNRSDCIRLIFERFIKEKDPEKADYLFGFVANDMPLYQWFLCIPSRTFYGYIRKLKTEDRIKIRYQLLIPTLSISRLKLTSEYTWFQRDPVSRLHSVFPQGDDPIQNIADFFHQLTTPTRFFYGHFNTHGQELALQIESICRLLNSDHELEQDDRIVILIHYLEEEYQKIPPGTSYEEPLRLQFAVNKLTSLMEKTKQLIAAQEDPEDSDCSEGPGL